MLIDAPPTPAAIQASACNTACMRRTVRPFRAWLNATAACESGGNYSTNTGNGFYGGLQFTLTSWRAVGGTTRPDLAPRLEQRYRAVLLRRIQGVGAWPVCGS